MRASVAELLTATLASAHTLVQSLRTSGSVWVPGGPRGTDPFPRPADHAVVLVECRDALRSDGGQLARVGLEGDRGQRVDHDMGVPAVEFAARSAPVPAQLAPDGSENAFASAGLSLLLLFGALAPGQPHCHQADDNAGEDGEREGTDFG